MRTPVPTLWMWGTLFCLVGLTGARFELHRRQAPAPPRETALLLAGPRVPQLASAEGLGRTPLATTSSGVVALEGALPSRAIQAHRVVADTIGADDSIYLGLKRHGVPEQQIARLILALERSSTPGPGPDPAMSSPCSSTALKLSGASSTLPPTPLSSPSV